MFLIYIKDVRKHLWRINNCETPQCAVENLCNQCKLLLCDLLEWAQNDNYYDNISRFGSQSRDTQAQNQSEEVGEPIKEAGTELSRAIETVSSHTESSTEEGEVEDK